MIITKDSHLDHGLTSEHLKLLFDLFGNRNSFFIETVIIKEPLPLVPCGLYGPRMGDRKVHDDHVLWERRGDRPYLSRVLPRVPMRLQDKLTVICGPHEGHPCILYTAFGGPLAPKEVRDPSLEKDRAESIQESIDFWADHALVSL
jgi:hypothetical protein